MKRELPQHKIGELAYFDSLSGLVPCKTVSLAETPLAKFVTVRVTAKTKLYKRGEILEQPQTRIVPRCNIRRRKYKTVIVGEWEWVN